MHLPGMTEVAQAEAATGINDDRPVRVTATSCRQAGGAVCPVGRLLAPSLLRTLLFGDQVFRWQCALHNCRRVTGEVRCAPSFGWLRLAGISFWYVAFQSLSLIATQAQSDDESHFRPNQTIG